jgi:TonB family protein
MKQIYSLMALAILLLCMPGSYTALAQIQEVRFYDKNMQPTQEERATYRGVVETFDVKSAAGVITCYTMDSVLVSKVEYSNVGLRKEATVVHGTSTSFYSNGQKREETTMTEGYRQGSHKEWYENGNLKYSMSYAKSQLDGALLGYYESGELRRKDTYRNGKLTEGSVFAEDGSKLPYVPHFELPQHPGGEDAMMQFLIKNMRYPKEAQRSGESGLVVVRFMVNTDGTFDQLVILKSAGPSLDKEAIRVIHAMPRWQPGKREGVAEAVEYVLPLRFAIR